DFARSFTLRCEATGELSLPIAPPRPRTNPRPTSKPNSAGITAMGPRVGVSPSMPLVPGPFGPFALPPIVPIPSAPLAWFPSRSAPPPPLGRGEIGIDAGTEPHGPFVPMRVYAWGPKGSAWSRAGRWQARFDDRFDLPGTRSTAVTSSPF